MKQKTDNCTIPYARATPLLVVISGPSGVGKDAVLKIMKEKRYPLHYAVTMTTRPKRDNETDGVDYHFATADDFRRLIREGGLFEWAEVYGHYYGVPRAQVNKALAEGRDVLLKVDVQGAATVKSIAPDAVLIFLLPPSYEELKRRLTMRHTESEANLDLRLSTAKKEMDSLPLFDYAAVNECDDLDKVAATVMSIITAEKCRTTRKQA